MKMLLIALVAVSIFALHAEVMAQNGGKDAVRTKPSDAAAQVPTTVQSGDRLSVDAPAGKEGEIKRWNFENGWPSKFSGPSPKADQKQ